MPEPVLVEVTLVNVAEATPVQRSAWERLWQLLLANVPTNGNAPSGELEASK
jgi:hypothetical protein